MLRGGVNTSNKKTKGITVPALNTRGERGRNGRGEVREDRERGEGVNSHANSLKNEGQTPPSYTTFDQAAHAPVAGQAHRQMHRRD